MSHNQEYLLETQAACTKVFQITLKKIPENKNSTGCTLQSPTTKHKIHGRTNTTNNKPPAQQMKNKRKNLHSISNVKENIKTTNAKHMENRMGTFHPKFCRKRQKLIR